jgi:hypothetical protein
MRRTLRPHFVDPEDLDIFRVVDDPHEVVKLVKSGVKKHWWRPLDEDLIAAKNLADVKKNPLAGARSANTGEGTRYGKRAKQTPRKHAKSTQKPQQ